MRRHEPTAAWPVALIAVGNAIVLAILRRALSEAAFMAVMIWFVALLHTAEAATKEGVKTAFS